MKRLPKYKKGGSSKTDFISEKTAQLISKEGMKASEAYAVANAMYMQQNKEYQYGGFQLNAQNKNPFSQLQTPPNEIGFQPQTQFGSTNYVSPLSTDSLKAGENFIKENPLPQGIVSNSLNLETPIMDKYGYDYKSTQNNNNNSIQKPNENYRQQFFDSYAGIDIPTSAYTLGEGIQTGNTWETIGSGVKLAAGLARNAFAGAGNAKRREYVLKDAQEKYRDSLTPDAQGFQMGGYYQSGGMQSPQEEQMEGKRSNPQEDQGEIDPNQIAQALQQGADPNEVIQMIIQNGVPEQQAVQMIQQIIQQLQSQGQQAPQPTEEAVMMQDGGKKYKALTGEYTIEKDGIKDEDVVAELEHKEILKTPTQEITQIDGETHEKGGAKLTEDQIPEGSEIISDHLKLTKEQVKVFSNNYDLKLSTKDTYADVLHKWNKKNGLEKNIKEQEELIKSIEKQTKLLQEKPEAEVTITLNIDLLQKELAELEKEKQPLEEERKAVFDKVFKAQELQKPKEKEQQSMMQNGGMFNGDMIISYAKKHNISPERAMQLVESYQSGGVKKYQNGDKRPTYITQFDNQYQAPWGVIQPTYAPPTTQQQNIGVVGSGNFGSMTAPIISTTPATYATHVAPYISTPPQGSYNGNTSQKVVNSNPQPQNASNNRVVESYNPNDYPDFFIPSKWAKNSYTNQPYIEGVTTASGELSDVQGIRERMTDQSQKLPYLSKRVNLLDGNAVNLGSIGKFQPGYDEYVDVTNIEIDNNPYLSTKQKEDYKKIATAQKLNLSSKDGKYDAIYGEETSTRHPFKLPYLTVEDRKKYPNLSYLGDAFDENGNIKSEFESLDTKTKDLLKSTFKRQGAKAFDIQLGEVGQPVETPDGDTLKKVEEDNTFNKDLFNRGADTETRYGIMPLPDQYAPLPDALQGNLKLEYRPNLVDKQNVTAEPIIAEIRRQEQSAMQAIQNLPDAQRAAATAQLQANTQEQINKAMNQVQGQNLQSDVTVANTNAGILNNAQDINNRYTLDFEGKILKADALTRNDVRNWMNHNQAVNVANSKAINQLNYYNALSEYNQITPNGIVQTKEPEFRYGNLSNAQIEMEAKKIEDERKRREKEASKKPKAKNGGRIKRKL